MSKSSDKFYTKNWFIILSLIFFFPLGIFLMWRNKKWSSKTRWILTISAIIFSLIIISTEDETDSAASNDLNEQETTEVTANEETENEENQNSEEEENLVKNEGNDENENNPNEPEDDISKLEKEANNEKEIEKNEEKQKDEKKSTNGTLKTHFIDVGQAEAILLEYKDSHDSYHILFDTGDWRRKDAVQYLHNLDIQSLDLVIISHPHADHIGQLEHIMKDFSVEEVWMSGNTTTSNVFQRSLEAILDSDAQYYEPTAGESFNVGPLQIDVVHPNSLTGDLNADSITTKITYGSISFLLTGDATTSSEQKMMNYGNIQAHILSLGHHGSNTSTGTSFLKAVNPEVAIYSAGRDNQYGHPHPDVVKRVKDQKIKLYGTDVHGSIIVETNGKSYDVQTGKSGEIAVKTKNKQESNKQSSSSASSKQGKQRITSKEEKKEEKTEPIGDCIDINSATLEELQEIIHIGPARAEELLEKRPFASVDDLIKISGIGKVRLKEIKEEGKACVR